MLTTVIRALQYTMEVAFDSKKLRLPDQEAIILFLHFYKLVFLGTKFAEKVLQIRLQNSETAEKVVIVEEESKLADSVLIDTSEISEPDLQARNSGGSVKSEQATADKEDNYFKIKTHAVACLQTLFKNNNKAFSLKSLYHPIFPSFLTNPRPEFI